MSNKIIQIVDIFKRAGGKQKMEKTTVKIWGRDIPPYETFYWGVSEGYFFGVIGGEFHGR